MSVQKRYFANPETGEVQESQVGVDAEGDVLPSNVPLTPAGPPTYRLDNPQGKEVKVEELGIYAQLGRTIVTVFPEGGTRWNEASEEDFIAWTDLEAERLIAELPPVDLLDFPVVGQPVEDAKTK